jgi:zinc protease
VKSQLALAAMGMFTAGCATPRQVAQLRYSGDPPAAGEAFRASPPDLPPVTEVVDPAPSESTLPNGMHLVLFERHGFPSIAAQLVIDRGSLDVDDAGGAQVAQMLYLYGRGGSAKAFEGLEATTRTIRYGYGASGSAEFCWATSFSSEAAALVSLLARSTFGAQLDDTEYGLREGEWTATAAAHAVSPDATERLLLFGEHPYGYVWPGRTKISADDARSLHDRLYQPTHATLVVVGDVTPTQIEQTVAVAFGAWAPGVPVPQKPEPPPVLTGPGVSIIRRVGLTQVRGIVFARGPVASTSDAVPFRLLGTLLGGGISSRLFEVLRQENGDTYDPRATVGRERTASWMAVDASYDAGKAIDGVRTVLETIRDVRAGKITEAEVSVARATMLANWRSRLATAAGAAALYADALSTGAGLDSVRTFSERLANVGRDDVIRVAARYLTDEATRVVLIGDDRRLDASALGMGQPTVLPPPR